MKKTSWPLGEAHGRDQGGWHRAEFSESRAKLDEANLLTIERRKTETKCVIFATWVGGWRKDEKSRSEFKKMDARLVGTVRSMHYGPRVNIFCGTMAKLRLRAGRPWRGHRALCGRGAIVEL